MMHATGILQFRKKLTLRTVKLQILHEGEIGTRVQLWKFGGFYYHSIAFPSSSQSGIILPQQRHLVTSGGIFVCHNWEERATGI